MENERKGNSGTALRKVVAAPLLSEAEFEEVSEEYKALEKRLDEIVKELKDLVGRHKSWQPSFIFAVIPAIVNTKEELQAPIRTEIEGASLGLGILMNELQSHKILQEFAQIVKSLNGDTSAD